MKAVCRVAGRLGGWGRVMDMEGNLTFSFDTAVLVTSRQKS